jgi:UDPglucose--hexose-1-phosphate uridylyltransferase
MFHKVLKKPDGRELNLYSRREIPPNIKAPVPFLLSERPNPHFRWHRLRNEWVAYAAHRQNRTFLPPPEYSPLAATVEGGTPTEVPDGDYDVAVFENLFPAMTFHPHERPSGNSEFHRPASGVCEVVVYSQDSKGSFGRLPLSHMETVLNVWAHRTTELGNREGIAYVFPFENRGVEVGVTIHHPHGQIYAYPFVPPVAKQMVQSQQDYRAKNSGGLMESIIENELQSRARLIYEGEEAVAFLPEFARYPYEVWVAPRKRTAFLSELSSMALSDLARALKTVLLKYDGLWDRPFPYLMFLYQAPTDATSANDFHLHFEFLPPYRTRDRLKYLAGTELGAGMFANDSLPEEKAAELQQVRISLE